MWFWAVVGFAILFSIVATFMVGSWIPFSQQNAAMFIVAFVGLVVILASLTGRYYPIVRILGVLYTLTFLVGYFASYFGKAM